MFTRTWSEILAVVEVLTLLVGKVQSFHAHTVKNHVIANENLLLRRFNVTDWMSCIVACKNEPECFSYNYQYTKKTNGLCELLECGVDQQRELKNELRYAYGFVFQQLKQHENMKRCSTGCGIGWTHFRSHCYKAIDQGKNWTEASQYCQDKRGNLASIHSEEENKFLAKSMGAGLWNFWIGLKSTTQKCLVDPLHELWYSDNTAISRYNAFAPNRACTCPAEPDCYCVQVSGNEWFYAKCNDKLPFVCKQ